MQLEFHQLDRRWEHLWVRHPARQRRSWASLADSGQQTPIVVVASEGHADRDDLRAISAPAAAAGRLFVYSGRLWIPKTPSGLKMQVFAPFEIKTGQQVLAHVTLLLRAVFLHLLERHVEKPSDLALALACGTTRGADVASEITIKGSSGRRLL